MTVGLDLTARLAQRLASISREFPDLAAAVRLLGAVIPVIQNEELPRPSIPRTAEEIREQLAAGRPLLECLDLDIDVPRVTGLLVRLAAAAESAGARVNAEQVRIWLDMVRWRQRSDFLSLLTGDIGLWKGLELVGMDRAVCQFLAQTAVKPYLRAWSRAFARLAHEAKWDRGTCFVCGAPPLLAELQGNGQEKHLRCGICAADWRVTRLSCSRCGNEEHRSLRVLYLETGHAGPRIEACDRCKTYLKVIPAFSPTLPDLLPIEDLATLHLDVEARKRGYQRQTHADHPADRPGNLSRNHTRRIYHEVRTKA